MGGHDEVQGDTYGFELAWGLRGAGTSQRTRGPKLVYMRSIYAE